MSDVELFFLIFGCVLGIGYFVCLGFRIYYHIKGDKK